VPAAPSDPESARASVPPSGVQLGEAVPMQTPAMQVSPVVQALLSLHARPLTTGPHVPSAAAPAVTLQATQSVAPPPHAVAQQTPSTQKPLGQPTDDVQPLTGASSVKIRARTRDTGNPDWLSGSM
jgi:hypothetical protein